MVRKGSIKNDSWLVTGHVLIKLTKGTGLKSIKVPYQVYYEGIHTFIVHFGAGWQYFYSKPCFSKS